MTNRGECPDEDDGGGDDAMPPAWTPGRAIDSRLILGRATSVQIRHGDETYTLRETRAGKLILTK